MRCRKVRKILEEGSHGDPHVQAHVKSCPACGESAAGWSVLRSGFRQLRREEPPEVSWGFAERLLRRLEVAVQRPSEELIEMAGRRIVYVTLLITLLVLVSLWAPSSRPRGAGGTAEVLVARPEMAEVSQEAPLGLGSLALVPSRLAGQTAAGGQRQK